MFITLSPIRMDQTLTAARTGTGLVLNGTTVDLLSYDSEAAPNPWIVGQPFEEAGVWQVTLILPHGGNAPEDTRHPRPVMVESDGPILLPPYDGPSMDSDGDIPLPTF